MADVVEDLSAAHKVAYGDEMPVLLPEIAKVQEDIKFESSIKLGKDYEFPVRLAYPGGFTKAIGDGTAGAFSLNDSKGGTQKLATATAYQILLRDQMSYEDAAKATGGKASYIKNTEFFFNGLQKSMRKEVEIMMLYGGVGVGKLSAYTSGDPSITIAASDWAPQIWAGQEGREIDVMSGTSSTVRGTVSIVSVDIENRKITMSGTVTGAAANDIVYFKGGYGQEMFGLDKILTNTGTLFGISASTYSLWKASSLSLSSTSLSFAAIKKAAAKAVGKGLDEDLVLYCNPGGWDDLATDVASLRTVDKSEVKRVELGAEELVYHTQSGTITVKSHAMVKEGKAYGVAPKRFKRIGAVDVKLGAPGFDTPWFHLPTKAGVEGRIYTNQLLAPEMPGINFYIDGIVNTTA